jgi:hypothetical protein
MFSSKTSSARQKIHTENDEQLLGDFPEDFCHLLKIRTFRSSARFKKIPYFQMIALGICEFSGVQMHIL